MIKNVCKKLEINFGKNNSYNKKSLSKTFDKRKNWIKKNLTLKFWPKKALTKKIPDKLFCLDKFYKKDIFEKNKNGSKLDIFDPKCG